MSIATRAGSLSGSAVYESSPSRAPSSGEAITSSTATIVTETATGRFITHVTTRPQNLRERSSPRCAASLRHVRALMRCPRMASSAGTAVSDRTAALNTAAIAPKPRDRMTAWGNTSMPLNAQISSRPENMTVRPAVRTVR